MKGIKEVFKCRLNREYLQFQESMLAQDRKEIYEFCSKIDAYWNFYEIILALAERIPEEQLEALYRKEDILGWLYEGWLKEDDSHFREMEQYVGNKILPEIVQGKESNTDGGNKDCEVIKCQ